ncbi:DNA primase [Mycobacterium sp. E3298]|nr:DNA primase [Mycobacterium sp. E3298]OBG93856.1 DNA primase [Mycobacterium sp. E3298]
MNDLKEIKQRIYEEDRVEELLLQLDCNHIRLSTNRYEAQLPDKFHSDNKRSLQVYLSEHLKCRVRSRGMDNIDIYGLVSYIVFDIEDETKMLQNIPRAKKWICDRLGYKEYIEGRFFEEKQEDPLAWLKQVRKQRGKKSAVPMTENKAYDDEILNQYIMFPHKKYLDDGLNYETQVEFQVGYDLYSERIIYPIHNQYGEIISIKGRTTVEDYKEKDIYKFLYLYNYIKIIEWYNWHRALYYILEKREVIIFEGEKSCWFATQYGFRNCISIGGDSISDFQVDMIKNLGLDVQIIIALDKDKDAEAFKKEGRKFGAARQVFAMWDSKGLLSKEDKDSPTDRGRDIFTALYEECFTHRIKYT